jgi:hypothetical protein
MNATVTTQATEQDRQRLYEARADILSCASPARVTASAAAQAHLAESCATLSDTYDTLRLAILSLLRDSTETQAARDAFAAAFADALTHYDYMRAEAKRALIKPKPSVRKLLTATELERRRDLLDCVLPTAPSDLPDTAPAQQVEYLTRTCAAVAADPTLSPLALHDDLAALLPDLSRLSADLSQERADDTLSSDDLKAARDALDTAARAHKKLVDAILTAQGRADDLGRFIQSAQPAYAARRRAKQPMTQEPDFDQVTTPIPPLDPPK